MRNQRLVWSENMANQMPHCMANSKGLPRRMWDMNLGLDAVCVEDHRNNPAAVADVQWLRFIHQFNRNWREANDGNDDGNPFVDNYESDNKRLIINSYHDFYIEGDVYTSCEEYWLVKPNSTSKWALIFGVYLNNDKQIANISCFDADYYDLCVKTHDEVVKKMYEDAKPVIW